MPGRDTDPTGRVNPRRARRRRGSSRLPRAVPGRLWSDVKRERAAASVRAVRARVGVVGARCPGRPLAHDLARGFGPRGPAALRAESTPSERAATADIGPRRSLVGPTPTR